MNFEEVDGAPDFLIMSYTWTRSHEEKVSSRSKFTRTMPSCRVYFIYHKPTGYFYDSMGRRAAKRSDLFDPFENDVAATVIAQKWQEKKDKGQAWP